MALNKGYVNLLKLYTVYNLSVRHETHVGQFIFRGGQKNLTILQNICEWNRWRGELVIERSSSDTQSISVAMERWFVEHRALCCGYLFKKQRFCRDSEDI
jgi:hypothetical protein